MTLTFEGEVWLEVDSTESFELTGDDVAFIQIARPGHVGLRRGSATPTTSRSRSRPPTAGWYPIRIGYTNGDAPATASSSRTASSADRWSPWTRDRLRARASELTGAMRIGVRPPDPRRRPTRTGGQVISRSRASTPGPLLATTAFTDRAPGCAGADELVGALRRPGLRGAAGRVHAPRRQRRR